MPKETSLPCSADIPMGIEPPPRVGPLTKDFVDSSIDKMVSQLPPCLIDLDRIQLIRTADLADMLKHLPLEVPHTEKATEDQWNTFLEKTIRPRLSYAILSHRWSEHEPDYKDALENFSTWHSQYPAVTSPSEAKTAGIRKLLDFCTVAHDRHRLNLAWSDTCCIDKTNSVELQQSLKSMFQWYRNAELCIVHLADTEAPDDAKAGKGEWRDAWFKRGWTLQELLAPKALKFYTRTWRELVGGSENDKENAELMRKLEAATGIKVEAIKNFVPGPTNVREKMAWAAGRETVREEDVAYILSGLFGVDMNVNYGEGSQEAFCRLQEQINRITPDTDDRSLLN